MGDTPSPPAGGLAALLHHPLMKAGMQRTSSKPGQARHLRGGDARGGSPLTGGAGAVPPVLPSLPRRPQGGIKGVQGPPC
ncbi:hypothetical protein KDAU_30370 [Dictyobacter aurantiacus]|uniref:Uncharacterized protein n=1 Tax=Dictyobacter aurantiacus TaxID=1936993 RepID=A0A401ZG92_9CHLR|nr:hypothetical protein KDAU_30370 [Dictyobacter aurantiacus]